MDEVKPNKELATLQIILKTCKPANYTGNVDGVPDPTVSDAIAKAVEFIKKKLPDDSTAQSFTISASSDGVVNGSVGSFAALYTKADRIDLYKTFEKSPFVKPPIVDEATFKTAVASTRSGIQNTFSGTSVNVEKLLSEFDSAVQSKQLKTLEDAFVQLASFKKSTPGSSVKTAVNLAQKNISQIIKNS